MASIELLNREGRAFHFEPIGTNALCRIEDELGLHFGRLLAELGVFGEAAWKLSTTREFFRRCSVPEVAPEDVGAIGNLIDDLGFDKVSQVLSMLIAPVYAREAVHA